MNFLMYVVLGTQKYTHLQDTSGSARTLWRRYTLLTASAHFSHSRTELPSVASKRRCSHALFALAHLYDAMPPCLGFRV